MPARTTGFSNVIAPGLRRIFVQDWDAYEDLHEEIFRMGESERSYEDDHRIAALGIVPPKPQGTATVYQDPVSGETRRYTAAAFSLGFRVTREMYDDDLYGVMSRRMAEALARSMHQRVLVDAFDIFNSGFVTTNNTGFDGLALFSTAHTRVPGVGGTDANTPTTGADLSVTSLEAAIRNMELTVDERGLNIVVKPKLLVVAPDLKYVARELLGSGHKPYTQTNEINPLLDEELTYLVSPFLTAPTAWFLLAEKRAHDLNFIWRTKPQFDAGDDYDTKDAKFSVFARYSVGFGNWRGAYGSPGG